MANAHAEWFGRLERSYVETDRPGPEGESPYRIWLLLDTQPTEDAARMTSDRLQREIAELIATAPVEIEAARGFD